jgi:hypothetical protein
VAAKPLADVHGLTSLTAQIEEFAVRQVVVKHRVRVLQSTGTSQRNQVGRTWSGTDQRDLAGREPEGIGGGV